MYPNQEKEIKKFLDPKADVVFKKIFGQHPDLIKSFLNNILPLPEGHMIQSLEYLPAEQTPRLPGLKNTIVDVKCKDENGNIFIVEMQMSWSKSFLSRFLYGASQAYVLQLKKGQKETYGNLCPVYGLALVNETFEPKIEDWIHHYRLTHKKNHDKTLKGIELIFLELPKFNPKTIEDKKIGVLWLRFLREADKLQEIPEEFKDSPEIIKAMELAQESAYTEAELVAYDEYIDAYMVQNTRVEDAKEEGREEERQKNLEEKKDMVKIMLSEGASLEFIQKVTRLDMKTIIDYDNLQRHKKNL